MRFVPLVIAGLLAWLSPSAVAQSSQTSFLAELLRSHADWFAPVLSNPAAFDVQILYTRIDRDEHNLPVFTTYSYRENPTRYFYPASTIKFPMILLALEKINRLQISGLTRDTPMFHEASWKGQLPVTSDTTAENGFPSVAHYARKIMVVSDNPAFNRLYDFVGPAEAGKSLAQKGYKTRISTRLSGSYTPAQNRMTNAVSFRQNDEVIYHQPMLTTDSVFSGPPIMRGRAHYAGGKLVRKPMNFAGKNFMSLRDGHDMLRSVIFPESTPPGKRFLLTDDDRRFLLKYMSQYPRETPWPAYFRDSTLTDNWVKYFLPSGSEASDSIRIFNKVGLAYGYVSDHAYVVDFGRKIEFLLSAVIYTNKDGIFNDDVYEYDEIAFPFMERLGRLIYDNECQRPRRYAPDLGEFRLKYDSPEPSAGYTRY